MAKKDNTNDETPIEFYIPGPGRGSKVPIPINQPNWKYLDENSLKPKPITTFIYLSLGLLMLFPSLALFIATINILIKTSDWSNLWFITISLLLMVVAINTLIMPIKQYINYKNSQQPKPKIKKPKQPKRPKNYK